MSDRIEKYGESTIQHGNGNDRVYLMKLDPDDLPEILDHMDRLAGEKGYSKIFAKIPSKHRRHFLARGFVEEAMVPNFFSGTRDGSFLGKYFSFERQKEDEPKTVQAVLTAAENSEPASPGIRPEFLSRIMNPGDCEAMAALYRRVFASYPFPIHDPVYLAKTMEANLVYWGVFSAQKELVALSSAEIDQAGENAEMTDFATHPDFRGKGLATFLLDAMETTMKARAIKTAYTIARAYSFGMNITFSRSGYQFAGTLVHNTNIFGRLESMNVWYKPLLKS